MSWRVPVTVILTLIIAWSASCSSPSGPGACDDPLGCVRLGKDSPLHLGVIQTLSGKIAVIGRDQIRGLELALERRGNTVLGRPVRLTIEDTGCVPEGGHIAALKMTADPSVAAVFGTTCSSDAAEAAKVLSEAGYTLISGNNSAPYLTSMGARKAAKWQPGFFRTARNEEHAGPAAARFAYRVLGLRRAAVLDDGDIYTRGLGEGFKREFLRLGGQIAASVTINKGDADMRPALEAVAASGAQVLFFPLFQPEGANVLRQARRMPEMAEVALLSDGALLNQSFLDDMGELAKGLHFVGPATPRASDAGSRLESQYLARYGEPPATDYYMSAFDAAEILFAALEKSAKTGPGGTVTIGRQALRDALRSTRDHPGVNEPLISCDQFGDCSTAQFDVLRLDDPTAGIKGLRANIVYRYVP